MRWKPLFVTEEWVVLDTNLVMKTQSLKSVSISETHSWKDWLQIDWLNIEISIVQKLTWRFTQIAKVYAMILFMKMWHSLKSKPIRQKWNALLWMQCMGLLWRVCFELLTLGQGPFCGSMSSNIMLLIEWWWQCQVLCFMLSYVNKYLLVTDSVACPCVNYSIIHICRYVGSKKQCEVWGYDVRIARWIWPDLIWSELLTAYGLTSWPDLPRSDAISALVLVLAASVAQKQLKVNQDPSHTHQPMLLQFALTNIISWTGIVNEREALRRSGMCYDTHGCAVRCYCLGVVGTLRCLQLPVTGRLSHRQSACLSSACHSHCLSCY